PPIGAFRRPRRATRQRRGLRGAAGAPTVPISLIGSGSFPPPFVVAVENSAPRCQRRRLLFYRSPNMATRPNLVNHFGESFPVVNTTVAQPGCNRWHWHTRVVQPLAEA